MPQTAQCADDENLCFGECKHLSDTCCSDGTICEYGTTCCGNGSCGYPPNYDRSGGPGSGSSGGFTCITADDISEECPSIDACCSLSSCYYEVDDEKFECDGTDCNDAAEDVVDYCTDTYGGGCSISHRVAMPPLAMFGVVFVATWARRLRKRRGDKVRKT